MAGAAASALNEDAAPSGSGLTQLWPWLALALPWLILINNLRLEWTVNAQYGYGFFVPLLAAYLAMLRWPTRPEPRPFQPAWLLWIVLAILAASFAPLGLIAEANPDWRLVSWALAGATVALTGGVLLHRAGWPWLRHFAFPLLFILVAVPWPQPTETALVNALTSHNASAATVVSNWLGIPAIAQQNIVQLAAGSVGVDDACSGVRSLQTTLMSALFFGEWLMLGWLRRGLLLAAGLLLALVCNFLRILTLIGLLVARGHDGMEAGHDLAGWSVVAVTFAGLWLIAKMLATGEPVRTGPPLERALRPWPRAGLLAIGAWLLLTQLGTQAWYRWHEAKLAEPVRWTVAWPREAPRFQNLPISEVTRALLKYQRGSSVQWFSPDGTARWNGFFFAWDAAKTASILARGHRPDVCLPATGREMVKDFGFETVRAAGLDLPIRVYQFRDQNQPLFVYHCFWEDRRPSVATVSPELAAANSLSRDHRWQAVLDGTRNSGQRVLEIVVWGPTTREQADAAFRAQIVPLIRR